MSDEQYAKLLAEAENGKRLSAPAAAALLEAWLGFRFKTHDKEVIMRFVESIERMLRRVEDRAAVLGWLDDDTDDPLVDVDNDQP